MNEVMIYHGGNRGVRRGLLFEGPKDYERFRTIFSYYAKKFEVWALVIVLMPNHDHLVFQCRTNAKTPFLRSVHWLYAWEYNQATGRHGHVFEERSWAFERWGTVLTPLVISYVLVNPELANLGIWVDYPYSDARALLGLEPAPSYLNRNLTLSFFSADPAQAPLLMRERVDLYASHKKEVLEVRQRWAGARRPSARALNAIEKVDLLTLTALEIQRGCGQVPGLRMEDLKLMALNRFDGVTLRMAAAVLDVSATAIHKRWTALRDYLSHHDAVATRAVESLNRVFRPAA